MNKKEIERIIETLERHYYIEKSGGMLSEQTKDIALLIQYIIELQEENKDLKADYGNKSQVERDMLRIQVSSREEVCNDLQNRIDNLEKELEQWKKKYGNQ